MKQAIKRNAWMLVKAVALGAAVFAAEKLSENKGGRRYGTSAKPNGKAFRASKGRQAGGRY